MKTTITIEQFDNGISITAITDTEVTAIVSLEHTKQAAIGGIIWDDILNLMNSTLMKKVKMDITYKAMD